MAATYVKFETPTDVSDQLFDLVGMGLDSGKIKKGTNEVTKIIERGEAMLVVMAEDVSPPELLAHIPILCKEKRVPFGYVKKKAELGRCVGLKKDTAAVVLVSLDKGSEKLDEVAKKLGKLGGGA